MRPHDDLILAKLIELSEDVARIEVKLDDLQSITPRVSKMEKDWRFVRNWSAGALAVLLALCGVAWQIYVELRG